MIVELIINININFDEIKHYYIAIYLLILKAILLIYVN